MKFDKFMSTAYRVLCIIVCIIVVIGSVRACQERSINASAVEISPSEQTGISEYFNTYGQNLNGIDFQLSEDEDGNRSARLQIYGLQKFALEDMTNAYLGMDFSTAPDTLTVSGGGGMALYKSHLDNLIHSVTLYTITGQGSSLSKPFISSDEFIVYWNFSNRYGSNCTFIPVTGYFGCQMSPYNSGGRVTFSCPSGYFSSSTLQVASGYDNASRWALYPGNDGGAISDIQTNFYSVSVGNLQPCGYAGSNITLPSGTVDTSTPWRYYNDTLLPYIRQNFNFPNIDDYLVFPDGYTEPFTPEYIEPTAQTKWFPIIIGIPIPTEIFDEDDAQILLDLLDLFIPNKLQFNVDGITIQFPRDGSEVVKIDGHEYPIPLPETEIDGHDISIPDLLHFVFDDINFNINADGTITIEGQTFTLPVGTPEQLPTGAENYIYEYEIPTMENINIVSQRLTPVDLSAFVGGVSFIWGVLGRFFYDFGLAPAVVASLGLSAIAFAMGKIGGH